MQSRTWRPGDGTPEGAALELLNDALRASGTGPGWFIVHFDPAPYPLEMGLHDENGAERVDVGDLVSLSGAMPDQSPVLAKAVARSLDDEEEEG